MKSCPTEAEFDDGAVRPARLHAGGRDREDDEIDRRRQKNAERAGGRDHAGAEAGRIALLQQRRQHDRADADDGRDRRARDRRKQRAGDDAGEAETAIPMSDQRGGEIDHAAGDAAGGEKVARQDEEWDRHDLEAVDAGEQLQAHHLRIDVGENEQISEHREPERDRDRHAGRHQRQQKNEQQLRAHGVRQIDDVEPRGEANAGQRQRNENDQRGRDGGAERPRRGRFRRIGENAHRAASPSGDAACRGTCSGGACRGAS